VKYGLDSSFGIQTAFRNPVGLGEDVVFRPHSHNARRAGPTAPAMSCNSQSPLAAQVRQSSGWSEM